MLILTKIKSMPKQSNDHTNSLSRLVFWSATFILVASFTILVLEKTRVTNFYTKPTLGSNLSDGIKPLNTVDLSPATDSETQEGERIKSEAAERQSSQTSNNTKIDVSLSAAGQDTKGGPVVVRAIISGTNVGICKLTISNSSLSKEYSADITNMGTYYGCKGFDLPITEIPVGKYNVTLTVSSDNLSSSVSQTIEVAR